MGDAAVAATVPPPTAEDETAIRDFLGSVFATPIVDEVLLMTIAGTTGPTAAVGIPTPLSTPPIVIT